jgi:hypothetical protein
MIHVLLETLPFLGGCIYGLSLSRSWCLLLWPNLLIGGSVAWLAGELTHGIANASLSVAADSLIALSGCLAIVFVRRFAPST